MSTRKLLLLCLATALSGACSLDGASSPPELALTTKPIANMSTTGYQRTTIQLSAQQSAEHGPWASASHQLGVVNSHRIARLQKNAALAAGA